MQLVLGGPDYEQLKQWRDNMLIAMSDIPELTNSDSDYQERKPQMKINVDRNRAAALGVSLSNVGRTLDRDEHCRAGARARVGCASS